MRGWIIHAMVFVVVNTFLIGIWTLTSGSVDELQAIGTDWSEALTPSFWPVFPILGWGLGLGLHLVAVFGALTRAAPSGRDQRRHARQQARRLERRERHGVPELGGPTPSGIPAMPPAGAVPAVPPTGPVPPTDPAAGGAVPADGPRTVTVMFSDLVGSTQLNETLGDEAYTKVLRAHRAMVRTALDRHGGTEVGTQGDGFLVRFDSPVDAVAAACDIQRARAAAHDAGTFHPELRIGIHAGDAMAHEGDLVGTVVNVASRVCGAAEGGEIMVSEPVAERVAGRVDLDDRGLVELRGLQQPRHLLAVEWATQATAETGDTADR